MPERTLGRRVLLTASKRVAQVQKAGSGVHAVLQSPSPPSPCFTPSGFAGGGETAGSLSLPPPSEAALASPLPG